jgi:hypothetical protein
MVMKEALRLGMREENIAATGPQHRHDQALISLLAYRDLAPLRLAEAAEYLCDRSPREREGPPVWIHRRAIRAADAEHFSARISSGGEPHLPQAPEPPGMGLELYRLRRWLGQWVPAAIYDGVRD